MAVARATESPGLSRFILPIAGLIGLRPVRAAASSSCIDPQGGPNLLASIYDALGNTSGATDLRNGSGRPVDRQAAAGGDRPGGRRRRHLAAVPRRRRAGQPAASRSGATGSCRGSSSGPPWRCWRSSCSTRRRERSCAASWTTRASFTLANYAVMADARVPRDPAQQRHLADRRRPAAASCSGSSSPGCSIASDGSRWPRPSSSCRWRSRSSARRSSGASSTPGSPPASRRSDC